MYWTDCLPRRTPRNAGAPIPVGVLKGEGAGPEIIGAALEALQAVVSPASVRVEICELGSIGSRAERIYATFLSEEIADFCEDVFSRGGAVLHGPAGGRFVYELRKRFDLFFKISPIRTALGLPLVSRFRLETIHDLDILVVRENSGGIYQGHWESTVSPHHGRLARHSFDYSEKQVRRFLQASARLARQRGGNLTVVWKESGLPSISELWRGCAEEVANEHGVRAQLVDIDLMSYLLVHEPQKFDVIAAPNLFGDVLSDLGAALLGSRGVSFSGNYSETGFAAYQTNHGAAHKLAGADRANPAGQIFSIAMMLRESFHLSLEAFAIEEAVRCIWQEGWRTEDVSLTGTRTIGTQEMGARIAERASEILESLSKLSIGDEAIAHTG